MSETPPLPVIAQNGFKVFAHQNGRFSTAVKVGNERLYARDYHVGALPVNDGMVEPDELNLHCCSNSRKPTNKRPYGGKGKDDDRNYTN